MDEKLAKEIKNINNFVFTSDFLFLLSVLAIHVSKEEYNLSVQKVVSLMREIKNPDALMLCLCSAIAFMIYNSDFECIKEKTEKFKEFLKDSEKDGYCA